MSESAQSWTLGDGVVDISDRKPGRIHKTTRISLSKVEGGRHVVREEVGNQGTLSEQRWNKDVWKCRHSLHLSLSFLSHLTYSLYGVSQLSLLQTTFYGFVSFASLVSSIKHSSFRNLIHPLLPRSQETFCLYCTQSWPTYHRTRLQQVSKPPSKKLRSHILIFWKSYNTSAYSTI